MGGNAFAAFLSASAFPRLPPPVYQSVKARLLPRILQCYTWVGVPREAPEKNDHGDLDFIVSDPRRPHTSFVPHDVVKQLIGAEHIIPMEGNRTSNYAVPIQPGEWSQFGLLSLEREKRQISEGGKIYYQVDVHVCTDKDEWDRIIFFHSYGDLGMILGLMARNNGLHLGVSGLKLPDQPNPPFNLSSSFDEICRFLGLSLPDFHKGFTTKHEVFEWATSMKYFDPRHFRTNGQGITKVKADRTMYAEFVDWVARNHPPTQDLPDFPQEALVSRIREEALKFFKKQEEYESVVAERSRRARLKEAFSGSRVRDWAQLGNYWRGAKLIMDEVRRRLGGEEGIYNFLKGNSEEDLKAIVLQVQVDLGVFPRQNADDNVTTVNKAFQNMALAENTGTKALGGGDRS